MKKLLLSITFLISFACAYAQYTRVNAHGMIYKRVLIDSLFRVPLDTMYKAEGAIAYVGGVFYGNFPYGYDTLGGSQSTILILDSLNDYPVILGNTLSIPYAHNPGVTGGVISHEDYNSFASKQPAGSYITSLQGDVEATGPGLVTSVIVPGAVTFSKFQQITAQRLLGRYSNTNGVMQEISLGSGFVLDTLTGVLTATGTGGGEDWDATLVIGNTTDETAIWQRADDATTGQYMLRGIPTNYNTAYASHGRAGRFGMGFQRFNGVNVSGRPNVVYSIWYNSLTGGGKELSDEASFRWALESHFELGYDAFELFYEIYPYTGSSKRPWAMYVNKTDASTGYDFLTVASWQTQTIAGNVLHSFNSTGNYTYHGYGGSVQSTWYNGTTSDEAYRLLVNNTTVFHNSFGLRQDFDAGVAITPIGGSNYPLTITSNAAGAWHNIYISGGTRTGNVYVLESIQEATEDNLIFLQNNENASTTSTSKIHFTNGTNAANIFFTNTNASHVWSANALNIINDAGPMRLYAAETSNILMAGLQVYMNDVPINMNNQYIFPTTAGTNGQALRIPAAGSAPHTLEWFTPGSGGLADPGGNGVVVRTALNTTINRTLTGTTNRIVITNGDGVSGNPTFDIGTDVVTLTGTQTLTNKTLTSPVINVGSDATGDIYYRNSSGIFTRLPATTNGFVLTLAAGIPSWVASTGSRFGVSGEDASASQVRTFTTDAANSFTFTSSISGAGQTLTVSNTGTGHAFVGDGGSSGTGGFFNGFRGVYGNADAGGAGVEGFSPSGNGMYARTNTGFAGWFQATPTTNNQVTTVLRLVRYNSQGTGVSANGAGIGIEFLAPTDTSPSAAIIGGSIEWTWSDVTDATRTGRIGFKLANNGAAPAIKFTIEGNGRIVLDDYETLATYADEAAAAAASLSQNTIYKTATGELRIKL